MRAFTVAVAAVLLIGCKPVDQESSGGGQQGAGVIDTMTQKSKVDAGRRAADQLHQISDQRNSQLEEISSN